MSPSHDFASLPEAARIEAAEWFARMRAPDAAASRAAFEAWLADPDHARAYDQLTARWEQSAFIGATATGRHRALPRASFPARRPVLAAAALIGAVGAGAMLAMALHRHPPRAGGVQVAGVQRFASGPAIQDVALSDGSHVTLDRASLVFVAYASGSRNLTLERGRARFTVAGDTVRPFVVDAAASRIVAHGTMFDVALQGPTALVTLFRGSVGVRARSASAPERRLVPGQQIALTDGRALGAPRSAPPDAGAWLGRMINLDDAALAEAVMRVQDGAPVRILLDPRVADLRITGAFRRGDAAALAEAAAAMFDLVLVRDPAGNIRLLPPAARPPKKSGG